MRLKCIGGPCHGKHMDCPNERIGDLVQVREPRKYDSNTPVFLDPYKASEMVTDIIHLYMVDSITYKNENTIVTQIKFLRHKDLEMWEAVRLALA